MDDTPDPKAPAIGVDAVEALFGWTCYTLSH
jgi:hypothetical protein